MWETHHNQQDQLSAAAVGLVHRWWCCWIQDASDFRMRTMPLVMVLFKICSPCSGRNFFKRMVMGQDITLLHCNLHIQIAFKKHWED
jgi:hypothetical protein